MGQLVEDMIKDDSDYLNCEVEYIKTKLITKLNQWIVTTTSKDLFSLVKAYARHF